jgi:L-ascorbate metabolism protein UlaG (beta-lactamase superfamily)
MNSLKPLVAGAMVLGSAMTVSASLRETEIETSEGAARVVVIEHATFVIEWDGKVIAVDPVGGGGAFAAHPAADLILVTDVHRDHLSLSTVAALTRDATVIVAPPAVAERFPETEQDRLLVLENGDREVWQNVGIEAVPMYNTTPGRQKFHPEGRGNGYVLTFGDTRVYISGDTEDIPEMRALDNIDAAFVCMNLPYTMDIKAAASAVLDFRPDIAIPYHYRGEDGMSDIKKFRKLVTKNSDVEVRLLEWY